MRSHVLVAAVLWCVAVNAGVLQLKDGTRVEGDLRPADKGWEVTTADGAKRFIPTDQVLSVGATDSPAAQEPGTAMARVESLRRAVEAMSDIDQIIGRYEKLMSQIQDAPALAQIRTEIAKWRELQSRGAVRIGNKWLEPAAVAAMDQQNQQLMAQAKDALAKEQQREAGELVRQILEADPAHLGALYLDGVIAYRLQQLPRARRAFDQVVEALPQHWPSVHNLAVLQWRQRSQPVALTNFLKVMNAMPLDLLVHDNLMEVANAMTPEMRNSPAGSRLLAQLEADEAKLQEKMAAQDRHRWGSTWITKAQIDKIAEQEAAIEKQLESMSAEFDKTEEEIVRVDRRIEDNEENIDVLERRTYGRDEEGRTVRLANPAGLTDLRRQSDDLKRERGRLQARLNELRRNAAQVQNKMPAPPFSGRLELFEAEHTPEYSRQTAATPAGQ